MTSIEHDNDAGLADLLADCLGWVNTSERVTATYAVIGLADFGEHPVPSTRLAEVLGRPVGEAEALAAVGLAGNAGRGRFISVNPERAKSAARRQVRIGDRRFGVTSRFRGTRPHRAATRTAVVSLYRVPSPAGRSAE